MNDVCIQCKKNKMFSMSFGLTNQISIKYIFVIVFFLNACANKNECQCLEGDEDMIIQKYSAKKENVQICYVNQGTFGRVIDLKICDKNSNLLIEKITLRGEDYRPTIDSIINSTVYVHYSYPKNEMENKIEILKFEDVVLGDALLDKKKLKYKYVFHNRKQK
ncbi:hypothetical protein OA88_18580 [Flavobacterium sp. JRM]|nr:hypothetical protein OA88_18580 [Flavobacterium sp. JRM]